MNRQGIWFAVGAYLMWGVLPIYWKLLRTVPALEILAHRISWSFLFLIGLIVLRSEGSSLCRAAADRKARWINACASGFIAVNWLTYIWGVNANRILETSLGYYINPLISVLLGVLFLREKLRPMQWLAVGIAALTVVYLTLQQGQLPWVAILLAVTFALYGLMKKISPLSALHGVVMETGVLTGPALLYLACSAYNGHGMFGRSSSTVNLLLACTGIVTALPLLLFAAAARRVPLSTIGLLQYISPTCGLLIGVGVYHEPFGPGRRLGFALIWLALGLYWYDSRARSLSPS
jgi:chloramphenicol-sensitive protein RarD